MKDSPNPQFLKLGPPKASVVTILISLATSVVFLVLFVRLADEVFEGELERFDLRVRLFIHGWSSPALTQFVKFFTSLASPVVLLGLFAVAGAAFLVAKRRDAVIWLGIAMAGAFVLDVALKHSFHRLRPASFFDVVPHSYSFPSGHALGSFCFYGVLAGLVNATIQSRITRICIWILAALLVVMIGISRVYLGVHYPTDVLAGYAAAGVWLGVLTATDRIRRFRAARAAVGLE